MILGKSMVRGSTVDEVPTAVNSGRSMVRGLTDSEVPTAAKQANRSCGSNSRLLARLRTLDPVRTASDADCGASHRE